MSIDLPYHLFSYKIFEKYPDQRPEKDDLLEEINGFGYSQTF